MKRPATDPLPEVIQAHTLDHQWATVLRRVQAGSSFLVMRESQPLAIIQPPPRLGLSPTIPSTIEPDIAQWCRRLLGLYTPARLAPALGIPPPLLHSLVQNGVLPERLFHRLTYLDQLAELLFSDGTKRPGRTWLDTPHRSLGGWTPAMHLRGSWKPDSPQCLHLLVLARQSFPPRA